MPLLLELLIHLLSADATNGQQGIDPDPAAVEEYSALGLIAKLWGESLVLKFLIAKLKQIWHYVLGDISFVPIGNGWLFIKFATTIDCAFAWHNRLWFVQGLNFVLRP